MTWRVYAGSEWTRSENLQRNEKLKTGSGLLANGGLALLAAGLARSFYDRLDGHAILWLVVGTLLMWGGIEMLALLEADKSDE